MDSQTFPTPAKEPPPPGYVKTEPILPDSAARNESVRDGVPLPTQNGTVTSYLDDPQTFKPDLTPNSPLKNFIQEWGVGLVIVAIGISIWLNL